MDLFNIVTKKGDPKMSEPFVPKDIAAKLIERIKYSQLLDRDAVIAELSRVTLVEHKVTLPCGEQLEIKDSGNQYFTLTRHDEDGDELDDWSLERSTLVGLKQIIDGALNEPKWKHK